MRILICIKIRDTAFTEDAETDSYREKYPFESESVVLQGYYPRFIPGVDLSMQIRIAGESISIQQVMHCSSFSYS